MYTITTLRKDHRSAQEKLRFDTKIAYLKRDLEDVLTAYRKVFPDYDLTKNEVHNVKLILQCLRYLGVPHTAELTFTAKARLMQENFPDEYTVTFYDHS